MWVTTVHFKTYLLRMPLILRHTLDLLTMFGAKNTTRLNIFIDCKMSSDSKNV